MACSSPRYFSEHNLRGCFGHTGCNTGGCGTKPMHGEVHVQGSPCLHVNPFVPHTANEGPVKILYKYLVPIYVFPEMKLLFPRQNYNDLSPPSSYTHKSVSDLYISRSGLPILLHGNMWTNPENI
jgi:hypothetical protein